MRKIISILTTIIVFLSVFCQVKQLWSQEDEYRLIELTGLVKSDRENQPLVFATVINTSTKKGTITDTLGLFYLKVAKYDTIRVSTIGYKNYFFSLRDSVVENKTFFVEIPLERDVVELEAVDVRALSWKQFKYQIVNMELEEEGPDVEKWLKSLFTSYELAAIAYDRNPGGIVIPFSLSNKKDKQRKKVRMLERQAEVDRIIDEKFNPTIVRETTGLDGEELLDFIQWCNFSRVWLLRTNGYDIIMEIKRRYNYYKKIKNK